MRIDAFACRLDRQLSLGLAALGVSMLAGCGSDAPEAPESVTPPPLPPFVSVDPPRQTVSVGAVVLFTASALGGVPPYSYQWRRNGVDIAGATSPTYMLSGAGPGDDGAQFQVRVVAANANMTATATLFVSPLPAVVFRDSDFPASDWSATATVQPAQNGPTHVESRVLAGGHPDAYRGITYEMTPAPSMVRLFHFPARSTYDPAIQGALYTVDLAQDCSRPAGSSALANDTVSALPIFEQAGRTYFTPQWAAICTQAWESRKLWSLQADAFIPLAGPPCGANETCPDFSASGAPLRFGLLTEATLGGASPAGTITQGIDNWNVTLWRK